MAAPKTLDKPIEKTLGESLRERGVSRRGFLKFCAATASMMALPPTLVPTIAAALEQAKRPSVIWLSFQECTACTESLTRSHAPTVEDLILDIISLDYHHTLQAAAGDAAELARTQAMRDHAGEYLVLVDGSIPGPDANPGFSTVAGHSNYDMLMETVEHAAAVIAIGTCAAFGGLPGANPNPTGAKSVMELVKDKPIVNVPGCPPIPKVITGVLVHYLTFGTLPELDAYGRPLAFYGQSIHDRCYRRPFYDKGDFAKSFDDKGARLAGVSINSAARVRAPTTPVPPCAGTTGPVGRSRLVIPVSAARSHASGMPAASTTQCRCPLALRG